MNDQQQQPVTVTWLNRYVATLLERDPFLSSVRVRGELSNCKLYTSGHLYFVLKDEQSSVSCVMFKAQVSKLRFRPVDGTRVVLTGRASLYDRDGKFQLYVNEMAADGVGDLFLAFEQLKKRLADEGLFDERHKKPLPTLPARIGVVTSPSGAVIRDILNVLGRRFPRFSLQLHPVPVQGEGASEKIAAAIRRLNERQEVDVIIVGRGGGSIEDLWAFNEEVVARAVFASRIPVISAVGHETDFTICDFVADRRAPTPSAAAELAMPVRSDLEDAIRLQRNRLVQALRSRARIAEERLNRLVGNRIFREPYLLIEKRQADLDRMHERQRLALERRLVSAKSGLQLLAGKLDSMSPLKVLSRGYGLVTDPMSGKPLTSVTRIRTGERVRVFLTDGSLGCTVDEILARSEEA